MTASDSKQESDQSSAPRLGPVGPTSNATTRVGRYISYYR